ncbi:protein lethal(2)essential for life isoform X1 [Pectinophora gossypiella]|uniref:protein lethal(2)essential for life isoform X1 n=1 Tax=Pectinophora gossypiella TaxID=13191 RepID=UPI00214F50C8|nr:protein lethal(2)essential for life isoform X1 [Pectinophora gossypiella]
MSIVPMMFRDWWDEWDRPSRLLDQHFGMGLRRDDLLSSLSTLPSTSLLRNSYFRPWRSNLTRQESASTINLTKDKFEILRSHIRARASAIRRCAESAFDDFRADSDNLSRWMDKVILDVQQFTPEEITVKASNNSVVVEGRHEEKQDEHGFISRQFTRRYILPGGYNVEDLVSTLSSDGVLTVTAPKRPPPNSGERIVPVTRTGPAKLPEEPKVEQPREQTVPIVTSPQPREQTVPIVTSP